MIFNYTCQTRPDIKYFIPNATSVSWALQCEQFLFCILQAPNIAYKTSGFFLV